jgi:hypothetical protein
MDIERNTERDVVLDYSNLIEGDVIIYNYHDYTTQTTTPYIGWVCSILGTAVEINDLMEIPGNKPINDYWTLDENTITEEYEFVRKITNIPPVDILGKIKKINPELFL